MNQMELGSNSVVYGLQSYLQLTFQFKGTTTLIFVICKLK